MRTLLLTCHGLLLGTALTLAVGGRAQESVAPREQQNTEELGYLNHAKSGIATLQGWYRQDTGLYRTVGWWNSANAVTVLANYSRLSGTREYLPIFRNTLEQGPKTTAGFLNRYYDDEGWWALAWIDVYDLTRDKRYLKQAGSIFTDMDGGWDSACGGGIWWSKDRQYKNAIANELFLSVAAELAARSKGAQKAAYLDWAQREWSWFEGSGMINADGLVNDGLTPACKNNGKTTWSYNQGVVLSGLAALNKVAPAPALLPAADRIADAALSRLTDANGVLHDPCEPHCGGDGVQFKGIFARNLMALGAVNPDVRYTRFAKANADSIVSADQGPNAQFGEVWSGPFSTANAGSQSSALDALVAAASAK